MHITNSQNSIKHIAPRAQIITSVFVDHLINSNSEHIQFRTHRFTIVSRDNSTNISRYRHVQNYVTIYIFAGEDDLSPFFAQERVLHLFCETVLDLAIVHFHAQVTRFALISAWNSKVVFFLFESYLKGRGSADSFVVLHFIYKSWCDYAFVNSRFVNVWLFFICLWFDGWDFEVCEIVAFKNYLNFCLRFIYRSCLRRRCSSTIQNKTFVQTLIITLPFLRPRTKSNVSTDKIDIRI